ncbi:MAG: hypothetical protein QXZ70_00475 [Candidatus Bathyarchaeia archaeon]
MKLDEFLFKTSKDYFYIMHLSYNGRKKPRLWNFAKEKKLIGLDAPGIVTDDWNKTVNLLSIDYPKSGLGNLTYFAERCRLETLS